MCTKEWPTNKEIPGMRDVSRNVDVTMPARTSIPALTGKSLYIEMGYMKKVSNETNNVHYLVVFYCLHKQTDISFWD